MRVCRYSAVSDGYDIQIFPYELFKMYRHLLKELPTLATQWPTLTPAGAVTVLQ